MRLGKPLALVLASLALTALAGCSQKPPPPPPPSPDAGCDPADPACNPPECTLPADCGDVRVYDCVDGACVAACTVKADCLKHPAYQNGPWPGCESGLCRCDARRCLPIACSADVECGAGKVCKAGACVDPDIDPDSCAVHPDTVVLRVGQQASFTATAYKREAVARLGAAPFAWSAAHASLVVVDADKGIFRGEAASGGWKETAIKAAVKANPAITCTARALVLAEAADAARVVVVDELTGLPVTGSKVVLDGQPMPEEADTPGVHLLSPKPAAAFTVTVFNSGYQYVTLAGVEVTDLLIPVRRNPDPTRAGGFTGKFTNFPATEVSFGITGTSVPGNYTDVDASVFVGRLADTEISFGGKTAEVELPSGSTLGIGARRFKDRYATWGGYGTCPNEDEMAAGVCGTRTAFGMMGTVPVAAAAPVINDLLDKKPVSLERLIKLGMPYLGSFAFAVERDLTYKLKTIPTDPKVLYQDPEAFRPLDFSPSIALGLKHTVNVPELPTASGTRLDGVVVIAGSRVPGRGLVPLGLSAGTDTDAACGEACAADGKVVGIDVVKEEPVELAYHDDGKINLPMAPAHGGIEGSPYGVITLAIPTAPLLNGAAATSAVAANFDSMPSGTEVSYPGGFLGFLEGADYDFRAGSFSNLTPVPSASVHRAVFVADGGRKWTVWFTGASFDLPAVPAGFEDRTMFDKANRATSTGPRSALQYWALKAQDGGALLGLDDLFAFDRSRALNLSAYLRAFSVFDGTPSLSFVAPSGAECGQNPAEPKTCRVLASYVFKVKVNGLSVPDQAKLLFESSGGEQVLVDAMGADWVAEGDFETDLMRDPPGSFHLITVTMVEPAATSVADAVPIDPKVSATLKVIVDI